MDFIWSILRRDNPSSFFHCPQEYRRNSPIPDVPHEEDTESESAASSSSANTPLSTRHRNKSSTHFPDLHHTPCVTQAHPPQSWSERDPVEAHELREHEEKRLAEKIRLRQLRQDVKDLVTYHQTWEDWAPIHEQNVSAFPRDAFNPPGMVEQCRWAHRMSSAQTMESLQKHIKQILEEIEGPIFAEKYPTCLEDLLDPITIYERAVPLVDHLLQLYKHKYRAEKKMIVRKHRMSRQDSATAVEHVDDKVDA